MTDKQAAKILMSALDGDMSNISNKKAIEAIARAIVALETVDILKKAMKYKEYQNGESMS